MMVTTAFSPKDFSGGASLTNFASPHGIPSSIHTRPQTAKQVRVPVIGTIASGLVASGEQRQESVSQVKFVPIMMEGRGIPAEPYNQCVIKSKEMNYSSSKGFARDERPQTQGDSGFRISKSSRMIPLSSVPYMLKSPSEVRYQEENKSSQRRVYSAKSNTKSTSGTQTQTQAQNAPQEQSAPIGKLNIDGEYFHSFKENSFKGLPKTTTSSDKKKTNVLDSWVSKEAKPFTRMGGQERDLL
jgi:hypothetical protein